MDFRSMLKKKKYAKWGNDDGGPDWGDLKHHDQEPEPEIQKVKEVRHQTSESYFSGGSPPCPVSAVVLILILTEGQRWCR